MGPQNFAMQVYLAWQYISLFNSFLDSYILFNIPKDTKEEQIVKESIDPSFFEAPSGAWIWT